VARATVLVLPSCIHNHILTPPFILRVFLYLFRRTRTTQPARRSFRRPAISQTRLSVKIFESCRGALRNSTSAPDWVCAGWAPEVSWKSLAPTRGLLAVFWQTLGVGLVSVVPLEVSATNRLSGPLNSSGPSAAKANRARASPCLLSRALAGHRERNSSIKTRGTSTRRAGRQAVVRILQDDRRHMTPYGQFRRKMTCATMCYIVGPRSASRSVSSPSLGSGS
jgi:hypothetical protein